jgi:hypothetical protein
LLSDAATIIERTFPQQEGGEQMGKTTNDKEERRVRHGGDAHRSTQKKPKGPVQGFSQAPKGLQ